MSSDNNNNNNSYSNVVLTQIPMKCGKSCDTYISQPKGEHKDGSLPVVFLLMDAFGLRARIYEMADHIASQGYYVIAPNLFFREGPTPLIRDLEKLKSPETIGDVICQIRCVAGKANKHEILGDVIELFDFIKTQKQCRPLSEKGLGVVGYCFGGAVASLAASRSKDVVATASYHAGNLVSDKEDSIHLEYKNITGEIYFGHADNDKSMTPEQIKVIEDQCTANKIKFKSELYAGAAHGWTMSDTLMWNEPACNKHWETLFDLFKRNL
ncbi:carboxymethylenebutenolidase like protein [Tieghemostelium lacteum]|uniref:Carboxymethylenebutenolidase like protein n=1 Tax=Tieghemostelium lacteum TaxID=361077 RepID=A0A151Z9R6_TIELA|nr:carboxymethylenebutenolidase like protein [Tieghemostelium lacteum]|eukprot:KYQ90673.1 carboxymethylenebutenolidase like protein [Tieghemostelium lacteum]